MLLGLPLLAAVLGGEGDDVVDVAAELSLELLWDLADLLDDVDEA